MADDRFTVWRETLLREKTIEPLRMGVSQEEVIATFGPPDTVSTEKKKGRPLIFKYADIELHFDHRRQHRLFLVYSEGPNLEAQVDIIDPNAQPSPEVNRASKFLRGEGEGER